MAITYLSSVANILSTNAWAMTDEEANLVRDISCIYKKSKCKLTYTDYPHEDTPKEIKECLIELSDTPSGIQLIVEYKNKSDEAKVFTGEKISISNNNKITSSCKETLKRKIEDYQNKVFKCEETLFTYAEIFDFCEKN